MAKKAVKSTTKADNAKVCAILAYFLVGIIWYFVDEKMKKNALAKHHTKQALLILIADIALWIISMVVGVIAVIPVLGWLIAGLWAIVAMVVSVILVVLWIFGLVYAIQGNTKPIPLIGKYDKHLTFF